MFPITICLLRPSQRQRKMETSTEMRPTRSAVQIEELANSITHGIGLVLSIAGFVVLLVFAILRGGALQIVSCGVYGSTLVSAYAPSTLYPPLPPPRAKRALKIF